MPLIHAPGAVIGYRKDGRPIRLQAGGSEAAPEGGTPPPVDPPAPPPTPPVTPPAQEETDWKAEARKWENRAKANGKAAEEFEAAKRATMTEAEKAVAAAREAGRTEVALEYGKKLAAARFETAVAAKGLDLGDALDLIDTTRFVDDKGDVDEAEIKKAVTKLAKIANPKVPSQSGGDFTGSGGALQTQSIDQQIAQAEKDRNFPLAIALKRQRAALSQ